MYVTYTSEIFPDPHRKKQVFVEQYLGLFLADLGLFCHFVLGPLTMAFSPKPPPLTWIAGKWPKDEAVLTPLGICTCTVK